MKLSSCETGTRLSRVVQPLKRISCVRRAYHNSRYLAHVMVDRIPHIFVNRLCRRDPTLARQVGLHLQTMLPEMNSAEDILAHLSNAGVEYFEGRHTIYLPPQKGLSRILGDCVRFYPPDAGFKILKNMEEESSRSYLYNRKQSYPWARRILMGSPRDVFDGACLVEVLQLGPRVYDFMTLETGGKPLTCYVVEHVFGEDPGIDECEQFIRRLKGYMDEGILGVLLPEGLDCGDFHPPHCNHNLIKDESGRCLYIDFQHFVLKDRKKVLDKILDQEIDTLHFGHPHFRTGQRFLYQEIPGLCPTAKRDTGKRWSRIRDILERNNVVLKDRLALDICCNSGMMLGCALSEGAFWGLGWDLPEVAGAANRIQRLLGNSRVDIAGAHLNEDYALAESIPTHLQSRLDGSVVFYLAASQHIGFLKRLASIPWSALVYEGHQTESDQVVSAHLQQIAKRWGCKMATRTTIKDGHCRTRPLALFVRS